jgi:predicted small lipoprotein YifL
MTNVLRASALIILASTTLAGCGKGGAALSESERTYADACTATLARFGQTGKQSQCECAARIVAPRLSPAELKAFNAPPELSGKVLTAENTAPHGFTPADYGTMMQKTSAAQAEVAQTCGT